MENIDILILLGLCAGFVLSMIFLVSWLRSSYRKGRDDYKESGLMERRRQKFIQEAKEKAEKHRKSGGGDQDQQ